MIYDGRLEELSSLIEFLGKVFGEGIEFTLHDFSKPGQTIIAISNGNVTNRKVGDSISDFTQRAVSENIRTEQDLIKLKAKIDSTRKDIRSSDMLLVGSDGAIRGLLCINISIKPFLDVQRIIGNFIKDTDQNPENNGEEAHDALSFNELATSIVNGVLSEAEVPPERMTFDERMKVIHQLKGKGVFQLKGVVNIVASRLNVSEATVYRYLGNTSDS